MSQDLEGLALVYVWWMGNAVEASQERIWHSALHNDFRINKCGKNAERQQKKKSVWRNMTDSDKSVKRALDDDNTLCNVGDMTVF